MKDGTTKKKILTKMVGPGTVPLKVIHCRLYPSGAHSPLSTDSQYSRVTLVRGNVV